MKRLVSYLFIYLFVYTAYGQNEVEVSQSPSWVDIQDYNKNPTIDEDELTQGTFTLLVDYQTNIFKEESYFRLVTKITENGGIQSASNISADYDPLYQKLIFHTLNIIRDGKVINKLVPEHFQVLRREINAESFLYDGSLSAIINLTDVRNGDVIDFSYSVKGFNPIQNGKFSDSYIFSDYVPIGKINVSINSKNKLNYKNFHTNLKPEITKNATYTNYNWIVETPEKFVYEESIPSWEIVMPTVVISEYNSWSEVVDWATEIYTINEKLSVDLKSKINEIQKNYNSEGARIKAILDFVQNEVRYLGLEYGISSYKPNSPNKIFEQRYGDCKDKSLLMVKMLEELNIEAYPMLLNSSLKTTLSDLPPSPSFFDHCVVKVIDNDDREFYYDPTISNQGGSYKNTHFPNYEYGLVVKDKYTGFDNILSSSLNKVVTLEEFVIKEINGNATLKVTSTYTDSEANRMRRYFKNNSNSNIIKEFENYYSNFYSNVILIDKPIITDNFSENKFIVTESYEIDSIWEPMLLKPGFVAIEFVPTSLTDIFYTTNLENRNNDVVLPYPVSREHITYITLPSDWGIEESSTEIDNNIFNYSFDVDYKDQFNKRVIQLKNNLFIKKSSITQDEFDTYRRDLDLVNDSSGYTIYIDQNTNDRKGVNYLFYLIAIGFIVFLVWIVKRNFDT